MIQLVCPSDRTVLELYDDRLVCGDGHEYPCVDGVAVLLDSNLEPTQAGYWGTVDEIERVRAVASPPVAGEVVDPYIANLIVGTHGNLYRGVSQLSRYPVPEFPLAAQAGDRLLDLGSNWGRWSLAAARAGFDVVGIDPSYEAIAAATRVARQLGEQATYVVADARQMPFDAGSFDVVFSYSVLQHFSRLDAERTVEEIARVLAPGVRRRQSPGSLQPCPR